MKYSYFVTICKEKEVKIYNLIYFIFLVLSFNICSCSSKHDDIKIKMLYSNSDVERNSIPILYKGVQIGKVYRHEMLQKGYILFTASLEKPIRIKSLRAVYKHDILGNVSIELLEELHSFGSDGLSQQSDTIVCEYKPSFFEIDSITKKKLLKEISGFKNKLDSVLNKR